MVMKTGPFKLRSTRPYAILIIAEKSLAEKNAGTRLKRRLFQQKNV